MNCKISANFVQSACKLCTISVPTLCKKTAFCTFQVAKTASLLYKYHKISFCASVQKKQLSVQVYTKPVYCTSVWITNLLYKCTQNQFTVQVYTKPSYCTSLHKTILLYKCTQNQFTVHKTNLLVNNERNVHGRNITKVRLCELCAKCVHTNCCFTSVNKTSLLYKCIQNCVQTGWH